MLVLMVTSAHMGGLTITLGRSEASHAAAAAWRAGAPAMHRCGTVRPSVRLPAHGASGCHAGCPPAASRLTLTHRTAAAVAMPKAATAVVGGRCCRVGIGPRRRRLLLLMLGVGWRQQRLGDVSVSLLLLLLLL